MKKHLCNRILSLVLAAVMVLGLLPGASAAPAGLRWKESDVEVSWDRDDRLVQDELHSMTAHKPTDMVRVSIVLEGTPTLKAGYSTNGIGSNSDAKAYDLQLQKAQQEMAKTISAQALGGKELDVVWNLTLASNIISANIPYGKIEAVKAVAGVENVVLERKYETTEVEKNTYTSAGMVGASTVWQTGLTGAGTRIAIIDTGTDTDHQSFDNRAYLYALQQNAAEKGMSYEEYVASLDLLDAEEIDSVLKHLNAYERVDEDGGATYYVNEKLPFGANYVDYNLTINHDWDNQGSHGSHVAGIAAANRYIRQGGSYVDARDTVRMSGVAPDAQIITLKVFGYNPGPYDGDYFAAIEDAIWLGCDSVNLSLGSGSPGFTNSILFEDLLDFMTTTDTVVVMSAGNSGYWAESTSTGYLYDDGVSFQTNGSPGSYTNPLTVASVENDGTVGNYIQVGDHMIVYTESEYSNRAMSTLDTTGNGTEYEYVFIDGLGRTEDYNGIDLEGKIVFCQRGEIAFSEKGNNAAALGAAAIVIYNNDSGVINMDLTDYNYKAPCISILQADGAAVKAASTKHTTSTGAYYTGTVTVTREMGATNYNSEYYTMSSFSSWGIPGSLEMKPEITAPGGMIWSVNGVESSGDAYEMMSGTSMAAPQITGMAALVAEYIQAEGLDEQTGLSVRQLTQSLLMSTSVPMREGASGGQYYSILNQGGGLARVDLATTAESYVLVDGMPDGKVKVELGEDADREGSYGFSFSINNMNGQAMTYELTGEMFTQDLFGDDYGNVYLDTWTRELGAEITFCVNGVSLENALDGFICDLNGDGATTAGDADFLLEYLLGNETALNADGDVNGDGSVTTYDAHVLLTRLSGVYSVDVPANGSVTVEVTMELTEETKEYLDTYYPTGAYVEAFVFAEPVNDAEGVEAVAHSIPVLGYYGSWSEPSMYDVGSYLEYFYESETRAPYLYELNGIRSNYVTMNYGDGTEYLFGGNPYVEDEAYLPERNAFNNKSGYKLHNLHFTQIRNSGNAMILVENLDTGAVLYSEELGGIEGAYYHTNAGAWQNTKYKIGIGQTFTGVPEGTHLRVSLVSAPELYCTYDNEGNVSTDWELVDEGGYLSTILTIDNTDPVLKNIQVTDHNTLKITAKDNEYIAAVALLNASGTSMLTAASANQTKRGVEMTCELDLSYVYGENFMVAVFDYAENVTVCEVTLELDNERPYFTAIDRTNINDDYSASYVGMEADGAAVRLTANSGRDLGRAAEYVDGMVFEITDENKLYVGSNDDLFTFTYVADLDPTGANEIVGFNDLAYNRADGKLYGLYYSSKNNMAVPFLCTIDMYTGALTVLGQMPIDANSMAIDGEGNFYSAIYASSQLYTYKSDVTKTGKATYVGRLDDYKCTTINSMAWDHNTNELYWACTNDTITNILKVDPKTAKTEFINYYGYVCVGLFIAYESNSNLFAPTNKVVSVAMPGEAATLVNNAMQLSAQVLPWNVSNNAITWKSSNPGVAIVDENGVVFGVSEGTAVITATSVLDATKSAACTVTVTALDQDLKCLVWDEEGMVHWASFNTDTIPVYQNLKDVDHNLPVNATMIVDGELYASTLDTSEGVSELYTVDPDTFEMTLVGPSNIAYLDMAYAPGMGYGLAVYFDYIVLIDLETGDYLGAWEWTEGMASNLVGITYYASQYNSNYGAYVDYFLILDQDGNVYLDGFLDNGYESGYFNGPEYGYIDTIGKPVDYSYFQGFYFDGYYTYWTRFCEEDNVVELIVWDTEGSGEVYNMGTFADGVWPVAGLYTDAELNGIYALIDEEMAAASLKTAELMTSIETVELDGSVKGSVNAVANTTPVVKPMSKAELTASGDVSAVITMPAEGTNGKISVTFDADKLELTGVAGQTDAFAWKLVSEGRIEIAFADRNVLSEEDAYAVLNFKALEKDGKTDLSVRYAEFNDDNIDLAEVITVRLPSTFTDVPAGSFYEDPVIWAVKNGVTTGATATTFNPNGNCQRAAVVTFLWRAAGSPEPTTTVNPFTDVKESDFFYKAVLWAVENEITNGLSATKFGPFELCNRAQVVTFLWRAMGKPDSSAEVSFTDVQAGQFYSTAVAWAVENGITNGISATEFGVNGICNRAQVVTFLYRTYNG